MVIDAYTVNLESIVFFAQTKLDGEEITLNQQENSVINQQTTQKSVQK